MMEFKRRESTSNKNEAAYIDMVNQGSFLDSFISKHTQVINNNSITNSALLNVLILSLTLLAKINITTFLLTVAFILHTATKEKTGLFGDRNPGYYFLILSLISIVFFQFDYSLISTLITRYIMNTYPIDNQELILTEVAFLFYSSIVDRSISNFGHLKNNALLCIGLFVYKYLLLDNNSSSENIKILVANNIKKIIYILLIVPVFTFILIDFQEFQNIGNLLRVLGLSAFAYLSYRILKVQIKSNVLQLSSLTSLILTTALPHPGIVSIPMHIKILTFPQIANYSPILKFLLLNATYMLIQFTYSFKTNSLGLLSDSLHMLLDCISLLLGYIAESRSKKKQYLSSIKSEEDIQLNGEEFKISADGLVVGGFTNGVLLLAIAGSVFLEGITRIFNMVSSSSYKTGEQTSLRFKHNIELLVVSFMGLVVNIVGLYFFEDHSHEDDHNHGKSNDNMRGVWLHLLADTMGSVFVVLSTILHIWLDNLLFDPLFSIALSFLILSTALPLIKSCFAKLMLFNQIVPHGEASAASECKEHDHNHSHSHAHNHDHSHEHSHSEKTKSSEHHKSEDFKKMLEQIERVQGIKGYRQFRFWSQSNSEEPNSHGHSHGPSNDNLTTQGFIHILVDKKEDYGGRTYMKKKINDITAKFDIELWVQIEDVSETCWCRL
jgi:Co/Zn/Cd efflux system component